MTIIVVCHHCRGTNKHQMGNPGFELLQTNFETFSDAHKHIMENPEHWMDFEIRGDDDGQ